MILLTKLNDIPFTLNDDLIETIEETPDTTIRLTTKNIVIVREPMSEVVARIIEYRKKINGLITVKKYESQNFEV